ncbi:hypothetical protein P20495_1947 [Pseudoalteromonas sp. BSi20495]|nr:hypothetical protein P20495_1947 [Pseudoalteromonas sp. BSi20495]
MFIFNNKNQVAKFKGDNLKKKGKIRIRQVVALFFVKL